MSNLILISFTPKEMSGGVNRWINDFIKCFPEAKSYSLWDYPHLKDINCLPEWESAKALNTYLRQSGKITKNDIIIVDGYWGLGLEDFPNVISVCHGIWSHLIKEEADAGMKPDFPMHHAIQVKYRKDHLKRNGRLVAVSEFIKHQMEIQWGFKSHVINNAIDLDKFKPINYNHHLDKQLVIHGVNDKNNPVKGWDHIEHIKNVYDKYFYIWSLDEAYDRLKHRSEIFGIEKFLTKYEVLSLADFVVIPSAYEGNSYFALETLACNVPVVAYDIGLFYEIQQKFEDQVGVILPRRHRNPLNTSSACSIISSLNQLSNYESREVAKNYSIQKFKKEWKKYLQQEFNYAV